MTDELKEVVQATKTGYLELKLPKSGWKPGYAVLVGGSLYYYKNMGDNHKGQIDFKDNDYSINNDSKTDSKKKFAFAIEKDGKAELCGQCNTKDERDAWAKDLVEALKRDPCDAPSKDGVAKRKKQTVTMNVKKGIASKTADSSVGKAIMKKIVNEETTTLINSLKALVAIESGSTKKADEMEKNIIKIAVKAYILVDNKDIKGEQFLVADKPLRDAFNLLVKVFNGRQKARKERVIEALQRVEIDLKKAETVITQLLAPHLGGKNMIRLTSIFQTVANVKFLETVFYNESVEQELEKLIDAMDYYTQFHYT